MYTQKKLSIGYGYWVWVLGMGIGYGYWVWVLGMGIGYGYLLHLRLT